MARSVSVSCFDYFGARYYDRSSYRFLSVDPEMNRDEALVNMQLWNLYTYCRNNPITYFDPDGREEGSWANIWTRIKISFIALKYDQSKLWGYWNKKDDFGSGTWKCNKFLYDVLKEAGAKAEIVIGFRRRLPLAGEWADKSVKIDGWRVLGANEKPMPGDVAAYKIPNCSGCTGHCGLIIIGKDGKFTNISAHENIVSTKPDHQFDKNPSTTFRRYIGEGEIK